MAIWRFFDFSIFRDGGRCHLGFLKFQIAGAAEPRGPGGQLTPPLFQVRGPHMDVDPHFL